MLLFIQKHLLQISLFLLACIYIITTYSHIDFNFCDEHGIIFAKWTETDSNYAPLYVLWLDCIGYLTNNHIYTNIINSLVINIFFALSIFLLIRIITNNITVAFSIFTLVLFSEIIFIAYPKVQIFASIMIVLACVYSYQKSELFWKCIIMSFAFLLAMYARPELKYFTVVFFLISVALYFKSVNNKTKLISLLIFCTSYIILNHVIFGNIFEDKTNRQILAFNQHYAFNYINYNQLSISPFLEYEPIIEKDFGKPQSILEALKLNPSAFTHHMFLNFRNYLWVFSDLFVGIFVPKYLFFQSGHVNTLVFLLIFVILISALKFKFSFQKEKLNKSDIFLVILLISLFGYFLLTNLLIAPRYQYLPLQIPCFIGLFCVFLKNSITIHGNKTHYINNVYFKTTLLLIIIISFSVFINKFNTINSDTIAQLNTLIKTHNISNLYVENKNLIHLLESKNIYTEFQKNNYGIATITELENKSVNKSVNDSLFVFSLIGRNYKFIYSPL